MIRIDVSGRRFAAACAAALICGCSGGTGASGSTAASSNSQSSSDVLKTSFSFLFDGKPISGTDTDMFQIVNVVRRKGDGLITFELRDISHYPSLWPHIVLTIADRGTTTVHGTDDSKYSMVLKGESEGLQYKTEEMTVTITSDTATRVTGTFSGRATRISDETPGTSILTDGKFDLPYATRKQ
jgi:hypothetical protein